MAARHLEKVGGAGKINYLFLCHLLSTWNARSYEFAATLFIAAAFPEGLSFMSWIGISTSLAVIAFASTLGRWIDTAPSRLRTLLTSIFINRIVIIASCIGWAIILAQGHPELLSKGDDESTEVDPNVSRLALVKFCFFIVVLVLGVLERLSRVANLLSIERDWVPSLAILETEYQHSQPPQNLAHLNAVMSRIDLVCKLISPIVTAFLVSLTQSPQFGPVALIAINIITWPLEYWTAWQVWIENRSLQVSKSKSEVTMGSDYDDNNAHRRSARRASDWILHSLTKLVDWFFNYIQCLKQYFSTEVWMPSMAMVSLHFSVLAFSGILTVFLLQSGFSVRLIMWGEVISAVFELSSTFLFAWGVKYFSKRTHEYVALQEEESEESNGEDPNSSEVLPKAADQSTGAAKLGMWALVQMLIVLTPTVPAIWQFSNLGAKDASETTEHNSAWQQHLAITLIVIFFVSASRLGRATNVLSTQQLAQSRVRPDQRSVFAGTETSLASLFGMGHWVITAIWSRHEDFKWVGCLSLLVVMGSTCLYGFWLSRRSLGGLSG